MGSDPSLPLSLAHWLGCLQGYRLSPLAFQVEEERSVGAEFVYAAANLRALNYGIPPTDRLEVVEGSLCGVG